MPRSSNQKLKLLYLAAILRKRTDETHTLSVSQIIQELERYGIKAERKAVYDDLEALRYFGLDVEQADGNNRQHFLASREFELAELKLLADAVASSKFITEKKSNQLIKKIEGLASDYEANQLQRQVLVSNRVKTANGQVYYNVDAIHQAISAQEMIEFRYFDYDVNKKKIYRDDGKRRKASPYALVWDDENYYVVAYYEKRASVVHFRVDKMEQISLTGERAIPMPKGFDLSNYSKKVFNMYAGEEETVYLQFDNSLIGVAIDRFGLEVPITQIEKDTFTIRVQIAVSPTFLGWLFQFGNRVKILSPDRLVESMEKQLREVQLAYEDQ